MNDLILLGTREIAIDGWTKPPYELSVRLNILFHRLHYHSSKYKWSTLHDLDIPYVDEHPIFKAYRHPIQMTEWEGIKVFKSACYPDGTYSTVHGYEGETWRLLIVGNDTDARNRQLVGNKNDFYEWAARVDRVLPTVEDVFKHLAPNRMRIRVGTRSSVADVNSAMSRSAGHWDVYHNHAGRNLLVEIACETDVHLVPNPDFVTGTNWQQHERDWCGGSDKRNV